MRRWLKAELHSHTLDDPVEGGQIVLHSAVELIRAAAEQGFEVLSITNHNQMLLDAELEAHARQLGIVLIPGVEACLKGRHVLLYNFLNYASCWEDFRVVKANKGPEQLVIAPHPFFPISCALRKEFVRHLGIFDAVEYNHFYLRRMNFNRQAEAMARKHDLPMVGNSDVHRLSQLGCTYSLIYAEKTVQGVLDSIRQGAVRVITQPVSAFFVSLWFAQNVALRARFALRTLRSSLSL